MTKEIAEMWASILSGSAQMTNYSEDEKFREYSVITGKGILLKTPKECFNVACRDYFLSILHSITR
jgi:hypothetical protein